MTPTVSVVLLSHNRPQLLKQALASLLSQTYSNIEIMVVDNRSPASAAIAALVAQFRNVKLISLARNEGYTGGMNAGIAAATGEYVYLTEDDIISDERCLESLVSFLSVHRDVGIASGVMFNKESGTIRCAGGIVALDCVFSMTILGAGAVNLCRLPLHCVNYVPGAMVFARTAFLRELGGFRSDYYMYFEDVELCLRVVKYGYRIAIVTHAKCFHWEPRAQNGCRSVSYHKFKNFIATYLLHASPRVLPRFVVRYSLGEAIRALRNDPKHLGVLALAWYYAASNAVALLRGRRRETRRAKRIARACP